MGGSRETANSMKWDVFVAHAGPDLAAAQEIRELLDNKGVSVYLDKANLDHGDKWDRELLEAQRDSRMTLVLVSANTKESHYQRDEITAAINLERSDPDAHRVVAVYLDDQAPNVSDVPYGLHNTHSIFAHDSGGMPGVAQLIAKSLAKIKSETKERIRQRDIVVELSHSQSKWDDFTKELDRRGLGDRLHVPRSLEKSAEYDGVSVLVVPLPFHSEFSNTEIEQLKSWVREGGGLFLLGYYTAGLHHENNVNHLSGVFDMELHENLVMPPGSSKEDCRSQVFGGSAHAVRIANPGETAHPLLDGVETLVVQSACPVEIQTRAEDALEIDAADADTWTPKGNKSPDGYLRIIERYEQAVNMARTPCVIAARTFSKGRIVLAGTWKIFTLDEGDNRKFVDNALRWLGAD